MIFQNKSCGCCNLENFTGSCELTLASCFREVWSAVIFREEVGTLFGVSGLLLFATILENPGSPWGVPLSSNWRSFVFISFRSFHDLICTVRDMLHFNNLRGQKGLSVVSFAFREWSVLFPCYCALGTAYSRDRTDWLCLFWHDCSCVPPSSQVLVLAFFKFHFWKQKATGNLMQITVLCSLIVGWAKWSQFAKASGKQCLKYVTYI